ISVIAGAVVNLVLNIPLIIKFGVFGAAVSTIIAELVVTGIQVYYVGQEFSIRMLFRGSWRYWAAGIPMFVIVYLLDMKLSISLINLVIEVSLGIIIYFGLLVIMRTPILKDIYQMLRSRMKRV
ncbi:MAG: polysaccharide biosynthesis C-terminal domain-containing protein, partial [Bacillota bacterium]|nr:polysaccharide biosynthesis C-terminal domain-containing protein [Bacillota bacterium]